MKLDGLIKSSTTNISNISQIKVHPDARVDLSSSYNSLSDNIVFTTNAHIVYRISIKSFHEYTSLPAKSSTDATHRFLIID